jgi:hypothetical protein
VHRWSVRCAVLAVVAAALVPVDGVGAQVLTGGTLRRYNPAYKAVPQISALRRAPKATIPIPLGLFQVLNDSTITDTDSSYYNPVQILNYIFNPPLYLEIKKAPTPTNDVEFFIGQNELIVDLGASSAIIPDNFGFATSQRLFNVGVDVRGFSVGVLAWFHTDAGITLGDSLRAFLKEAVPAQPLTRYSLDVDGVAQGGFAPQVGYAGRVWGDSARGIYAGATVRYYLGTAMVSARGEAGFTSDSVIFGGNNPVTEDAAGRTYKADPAPAAGRGFGTDLGVVYAAGPIEVGAGITDLGATLTWSETDIDSVQWDAAGDSLIEVTIGDNVEAKTKLPVSTILHGTYAFPTGTTVRAGILTNTRGTVLSLGGEQALGVFAVRAGLSRDQRDMVQYAWGGSIRLGPVGLNVDFFTHSRSLSEERGITMASTLSIY